MILITCDRCGGTEPVPSDQYAEDVMALHGCVWDRVDSAMGDDECRACAVCVPHGGCTNRRAS